MKATIKVDVNDLGISGVEDKSILHFKLSSVDSAYTYYDNDEKYIYISVGWDEYSLEYDETLWSKIKGVLI